MLDVLLNPRAAMSAILWLLFVILVVNTTASLTERFREWRWREHGQR